MYNPASCLKRFCKSFSNKLILSTYKLKMSSSPYSIKSYEQLRLLVEKEKYG
jgi:hypothetical protein